MSLYVPTWDKITGALGSTTKEIGGDWANLISDYYNGINIELIDPTKAPVIGTLTRYKFEKFGLYDNDQSHQIVFSVDDIDTGPQRKIKIRRMNNPYEQDYILLENNPAAFINKTIDFDSNFASNIDNSDIKVGAGITDNKLAQITDTSKLPSTTVYTNDTQTLLNKTLISPQMATILNGSATLTLPATTQFIVGRSTIDPLSNKTLDSITSTLKNLGNTKYTIFKDGSTYYCRNNASGAIEVSNTSPNTVIGFVFTNGGSCYIKGPCDYVLTGTTDPFFDFPLDPVTVEFYMDRDAWIVVPNGYTGRVFRLMNSLTNHCTGHKMGVHIKEAGTATLNYTGISFEAMGDTNSRGPFDNHVLYAYINKPSIGIKLINLTGSTKGFINANDFDHVFMWTPKVAGIDFVMDEPYSTISPNINGIHRNRFRNLLIQGNGADDTVGVRNIRHKDNSFYSCYVADFAGNSKTATIHADAVSTIIDGGSMDVTGRFEDNSTAQSSKIRSEFSNNVIGRIRPGISGTSMEIIPTGTTNTTSWYNSAVNERFYIQKSATDVLFDVVRQTGGSLRNLIFRMFDVPNSNTITEAMRIETDAGVRIMNNKLRLRDGGNDHNITVTVPDVAGTYNLAIPTITGNDTLATLNVASMGDAGMSAHTSTKISITNKAQLNSQIAYLDATTWLTNAMVSASAAIDWSKISKTGSILSDIANVILTSPAQWDILYRNASNQWVNLAKGTNNRFLGIDASGNLAYNFVTNANILAHTSTQITITNKSQLNNQIGYKDETSWVTDAMVASHTTSKISTISKSLLNNQIAYKDETAWLTGAMMVTPNVFQLIKKPTFGKKKGGYAGTSTSTGWGIMGGLTAIGTFTALDIDSTYGSYAPRTTGTTAGNNAGFSYANALSMRKFNPILAILVRTPNVSLNRMYIGWKSNATSPTSLTDDPLANLSGVMFLQRSGDTTWQICSNNGAASSTIVDTTAPISTTIPSNLQILADDANSKWQWSTDGGDTWIDVTGNFPAQTTKLFYVGECQTNEPGVTHRLDTFAVEVASDK